jgi:hypothetical protein
MKPEISILMPGIRPERWTSVYSSILESTKREFVLIIVGPYALPKELQEAKNVRYCKDFGTPMRAANIAGVLAEGKLIFSLMSDDSIFMPNVLDKAIDYLYEQEFSIKNAVMAFYKEGKDGTDKDIQSLEYFKINGSDSTKIYDVPNDWLIFNTVILYREFFDQLGGWDCSFEACPMGLTDFAIRAQKEGAKVFHIEDIILDCDHMPGTTGDHAPIHYGQIQHDEPFYKLKYSGGLEGINPCINIDNWKKADSVWSRRFK